ncbi:copper homeostasis protein CutC [Aeromonas caviae]
MRRHGASLCDDNMDTSDDGRVNITDGAKVAAVRALLDRA